MKNHNYAVLFVLAAFPLMTACSEEAGQKASVEVKAAAATKAAAVTGAVAGQPQAAKPAVAGAKPPAGQTAQLDAPPPLAVPHGYRYEARGRRDPFVNPLPKAPVAKEDAVPVVRPDGLPGVLVSEVKLSGIIYSPEQAMKKAMLVVGRSTYFARQGDSLFDGVIKEIRPNEVVFAMVSTTTKQPMNKVTVVRTGGNGATLPGEQK